MRKECSLAQRKVRPETTEGADAELARLGMQGFGAFILGRNMFGAERGPWKALSWKGWWGPNPPYHAPTFILTHHAREPIVMEGGTTFHFVTNPKTPSSARCA